MPSHFMIRCEPRIMNQLNSTWPVSVGPHTTGAGIPVFISALAATPLNTRIPVWGNHTVVSHDENHMHTQIEGCSAVGSKGGGYSWDHMHNSRRRCHSDVYKASLLCSRRRCREVSDWGAWGRSANHSKESDSPWNLMLRTDATLVIARAQQRHPAMSTTSVDGTYLAVA